MTAIDQHVFATAPIKSGVLLGLLPLPVHMFLPAGPSYQLAAITLVLIAGVYLGYAFKDGRAKAISIECIGAAAFATAAWLGLNGYPLAIVIALALHGVWDVLHVKLIDTDIPPWYVPFCSFVDWIMAAGLYLIWMMTH
ncbi:DUF6010 family protein [Thalassococcus sp. S3]|uniref:DUF6010 family protein n=1 Tax=Thalassococcus sp. S3 TaxID=2017482 RepID=UPI001024474C|nr:DUF6010 family protein [Thalassococcus sp. S3]QBF31411.1 hypothetical protein CFI11_09285 [Thalassococcus sp. S3]